MSKIVSFLSSIKVAIIDKVNRTILTGSWPNENMVVRKETSKAPLKRCQAVPK